MVPRVRRNEKVLVRRSLKPHSLALLPIYFLGLYSIRTVQFSISIIKIQQYILDTFTAITTFQLVLVFIEQTLGVVYGRQNNSHKTEQ